MRSDGKNLLIVPKSHNGYGDRNIRYCGPDLWNNLPDDMRSCDKLDTFKRKLKTLPFKAVFD